MAATEINTAWHMVKPCDMRKPINIHDMSISCTSWSKTSKAAQTPILLKWLCYISAWLWHPWNCGLVLGLSPHCPSRDHNIMLLHFHLFLQILLASVHCKNLDSWAQLKKFVLIHTILLWVIYLWNETHFVNFTRATFPLATHVSMHRGRLH